MKTLLHTCCAPCLVKCMDSLKEEGINPTLFWYNPNIHPFLEHENRKQTLVKYAESIDANLILHGEYGLKYFLSKLDNQFDNRCEKCYRIRLEETAKYASMNEFGSFSTTLLISPYQNHDLIREIAQSAEGKYKVNFLYKDFRPMFREGQKIARENNLYMQKYCGCIFSEEERYNRSQT